MPADHQNAVVYPWTAALAITSGVAAFPAANVVAALAASVLSSAVPREPPICWVVLTIAEATPASSSPTPPVAVAIDGAKIRPKPRPAMTSAGSTCVA